MNLSKEFVTERLSQLSQGHQKAYDMLQQHKGAIAAYEEIAARLAMPEPKLPDNVEEFPKQDV